MATKRDFERTAAVIKSRMSEHDGHDHGPFERAMIEAQKSIAIALADMYQQDNPRFDRERFLTACGL